MRARNDNQMTYVPWTEEDDRFMDELVANKYSLRDVALKMGRTYESIKHRRRQRRGYIWHRKMDPKVRTKRSCMNCQHEFNSEGPHNRLCSRCRLEPGETIFEEWAAA